jgi:hypothetical protein
MSFGYSVGDIISVTALAWNVYARFKDAPKGFSDLSRDVHSLHSVLAETRNLVEGRIDLSPVGNRGDRRAKGSDSLQHWISDRV